VLRNFNTLPIVTQTLPEVIFTTGNIMQEPFVQQSLKSYN